MASQGKSASKHEYNKPRLKEQIDSAMLAYLKSGKAVERVPTVLSPEPPPPASEADNSAEESAVEEEAPAPEGATS